MSDQLIESTLLAVPAAVALRYQASTELDGLRQMTVCIARFK